jgi:hypothetical protein
MKSELAIWEEARERISDANEWYSGGWYIAPLGGGKIRVCLGTALFEAAGFATAGFGFGDFPQSDAAKFWFRANERFRRLLRTDIPSYNDNHDHLSVLSAADAVIETLRAERDAQRKLPESDELSAPVAPEIAEA